MACPSRSNVFSGSANVASVRPAPRRKAVARLVSGAAWCTGAGSGSCGAGATGSSTAAGCGRTVWAGGGPDGSATSQSSGITEAGIGGRKALDSAGA